MLVSGYFFTTQHVPANEAYMLIGQIIGYQTFYGSTDIGFVLSRFFNASTCYGYQTLGIVLPVVKHAP